jgi:hypothetical protein
MLGVGLVHRFHGQILERPSLASLEHYGFAIGAPSNLVPDVVVLHQGMEWFECGDYGPLSLGIGKQLGERLGAAAIGYARALPIWTGCRSQIRRVGQF